MTGLYPNILQLLGSISPKHPLELIEPLEPEFVIYLDGLLGRAIAVIESLPDCDAQLKALSEKLNDRENFYPAVTEVETLIHLAEAGFTISVEPLKPLRGPDFFVQKEMLSSYVEVRSIGPDEREIGQELQGRYLEKRLGGAASCYSLVFTIPEHYRADTRELKAAVNATLVQLRQVEGSGRQEACLYYFGPGSTYVAPRNLLLGGFDLNASEDDMELQSRATQAGTLSVDFQRTAETPGPMAYVWMGEPRSPGRNERIRDKLALKVSQMVPGHRNIIVIDISHANARKSDVADALYGSVQIDVAIPPANPRSAVISGQSRAPNGFFRKTTRVQAVIALRREIPEVGPGRTHWTIFPTNNDSAQASLSSPELEAFQAEVFVEE